ncbi:tetratricopeptide repeat protein [Ruegeria arenilitoris]|uniref:tetratricopeptide repeat protein n=1 Tax=Ruegeria arenilitoris TaxID=1173585 RepID=UPI001481521F|nr:tetratricopeptide repeat protein [Ruegeria arenilitoris]
MEGQGARIANSDDFKTNEVREQLQRILDQSAFAQAERQSKFLKYIVEQSLAGRDANLNQFSIGIDVFDRGEEFDPATDAIVRVEAGRLRSRIADYYATKGKNDPILIDLPKGGYVPVITMRMSECSDQNESSDQTGTALISRRLAYPALVAVFAGMSFLLWSAFSQDLGEMPPPLSSTDHSVAVLPFDNMSADPEQEYFSDGITEDIITDLSVISGLRVISRHSTFVYKGKRVTIREIGDELNVRYVLEGSVRRQGDRLRITAQLIDVASEGHIWAARFDRGVSDVFDVQDEVTAQIVSALEVALTDAEEVRLGHRNTSSVEAHDLYLRGQERFWHLDAAGVTEAIALFQAAIDTDPDYAEAYAWKARALTFAFLSGINSSKRETIDRAVDHANKAIKIDERLPMAYANLAWALRWHRELSEAQKTVETAITLEPSFADALLWKSMILSAASDGEGALNAINRAIELNPNYSVTYTLALGRAYFALGDYETALANFQRTVTRNPQFLPGRIHEALALERLGKVEASNSAFSSIEEAFPDYRNSPSYKIILLEWPE